MLLSAGFTMTVHLVELTVVRRINPYAIHGYQYLFKPGPAAAHTDLGICEKDGYKAGSPIPGARGSHVAKYPDEQDLWHWRMAVPRPGLNRWSRRPRRMDVAEMADVARPTQRQIVSELGDVLHDLPAFLTAPDCHCGFADRRCNSLDRPMTGVTGSGAAVYAQRREPHLEVGGGDRMSWCSSGGRGRRPWSVELRS